MAKAERTEVMSVDRDALFKVITDYEKYPEFVSGVKKAKLQSRSGSVAKVQYLIDLMKEIDYTLDHLEDAAAGKVTWKLVSSALFKKNNGGWTLKSVGPGKTEATYSVEIEFGIPVPGFVLNQLIKSTLPAMMKGFEKRVKEVGAK